MGINNYDGIKYLGMILEEERKKDKDLDKAMNKKNKSLTECWEYIKEVLLEGKSRTNGMCVAGKDEDLVAECLHYYQEDNIKPKGTARNAVATTSPKPKKKKEDDEFEKLFNDDDTDVQPHVELKVVANNTKPKQKKKKEEDNSDDIFASLFE